MQVPLLAPLTSRQRLALCTSLSPRAAAAGETLVSKGEAGDTFFLIEEGSCVVVGEDGKVGSRGGSRRRAGAGAALRGVPASACVCVRVCV